MSKKVKVLFVCTGNACRSQMAEAWARRLRSDTIEPYSAGLIASGVDPRVRKVMEEAGVSLGKQYSKQIGEMLHVQPDYVVTLCDYADKQCPRFPGKAKRVHYGFDDPPSLAAGARSEEEALSHYRRVRDEIRAFVDKWLDGLMAKADSTGD